MTALTLDRIGVKVTSQDNNVRWVFQSISTRWSAGEQIGVIGPNGSGKTTLMRVMAGLIRPNQGKRIVEPRHERVFLVLQRPEDHFIYDSVGKQITAFAKGTLNQAALEQVLTEVGLPIDVASCRPMALSGGQQRLMAIACAVAAQATFVILDEPMAGLDYAGRQLVTQALRQLVDRQGIGLISVSHHPDDLLGLAERLWLLQDGQLKYDGPLGEAPCSVLRSYFADGDTSLYFGLRQLESLGVAIASSAYGLPDVSAVAAALELHS